MDLDGYIDLPPHRLAALVTYLARDLGNIEPGMPALPDGVTLERLAGRNAARYRHLFIRVGRDWLWFSRLRLTVSEIEALLDDPRIEALAVRAGEADIGLIELDYRNPDAPELVYFGLVPEALGRGLGGALMAEALRRARAAGLRRLQVHTCSLDHPRALPFYCRAGFRPVGRAIEIFDDPRLDGTLPRDAAPWLPLIEPRAR